MIIASGRSVTVSLRRIYRVAAGSGDLDALLLAGSIIASRFMGALAGLMLARWFGVVLFGEYATAVAFGAICATVADLNLASPVIRAYARERHRADVVYGNALITKVLATLVVLLGSVLITSTVARPQQASLMMLAAATALVGGFASLPVAVFQASSRVREMSAWTVGISGITALVAVVVAITGGGPRRVLGGVLLANAALSVLALVRSATVMRPTIRWRCLLRGVREWLPFAVGGIAYVIYYQVDQVMLGVMMPGTVPGVYAAAYRVASFLYIIPGAFAAAFYPRLFRAHGVPEKHRTVVRALLKRSGTFGCVGAVAVFMLAAPLIHLLYGPAYEDAAVLLRVLIWFPAIQSMSFPIGDALTTSERQVERIMVMVGAALFNVMGNLVVIPRAGGLGAAAVTLITECLILASYAVLWCRLGGVRSHRGIQDSVSDGADGG